MSPPEECTVLVVGGGPAGSYAASVLAREGINVTVIEMEQFPRYHIGESMLPSFRNFLRFIDLESKFQNHGFFRKNGASFKLNSKPVVYTDFIATKGATNSAWNVIRSEADELMFRHAGDCGAGIFDGTKVTSIKFEPENDPAMSFSSPGTPVSVSWSKKDGMTGSTRFKYLIDATGRAGLMSTRYLHNRQMNDSLKANASWGYWEGAETPRKGMKGENDPYFEALADGSGWVWAIPLHNQTMSVGVVMKQALMVEMKRKYDLSSQELYQKALNTTTLPSHLLPNAKLVSGVRSASDWSYNAPEYAGPNWRIIGDAGCFIDPFFSSGVHLAVTGGLSAAVTICATERGHCDPRKAAEWHSAKISDSYNRFLLVVTSCLKQIGDRDEPVLTEWNEGNFDRAFDIFQPVIQGSSDLPAEALPKKHSAQLLDFCMHALSHKDVGNLDTSELVKKLGLPASTVERYVQNVFSVMRQNQTSDVDDFGGNALNDMRPNLVRGQLGLVEV